MRSILKHEGERYLRLHIPQYSMSIEEADKLESYLSGLDFIEDVKVNERTCDLIIYHRDKKQVLNAIASFDYDQITVTVESGRVLAREGEEKIFWHLAKGAVKRLFLPAPIRYGLTVLKATKFVYLGLGCLLHGHLEVPVLDATAISAAIATGNHDTASSIMFLLGLSEIMEDWTRKKSEDDLARSLALNVDMIWTIRDGKEVLFPVSQIKAGDEILVRSGSIIPLDGVITKGNISVNQASMTGESTAVFKDEGVSVYAGTVVEEGEAVIRVTSISGNSRYDRIIEMIRDSERLKSDLEDRAFAFSDRLVPVSLGLTAGVYLLTRNVTKAMAVLMVDYSCALKLSMPIAVLSAMQEASRKHITVKGGKYLENFAKADTIIFDKTGTLTHCEPRVEKIVTFEDMSEDEALCLAACMEEHYPHSIANAVVAKADERGLDHKTELHSKIEYVIAHGVAATVSGKNALLGSYHFIFEDNRCTIPQKEKKKFSSIEEEYTHIYLSINGRLSAVLCISDPLRENAAEVISRLKELSFSSIIMLTGDNRKTAEAIAAKAGIDVCHSEVLPEDKAFYVNEEKKKGHTVIMLGDGINDSPALSAADVGVAISQGAPIARQIADITISGDDLNALCELRELATALQNKISHNYRFIMGFNSLLILGGIFSVLSPATAAYLHNLSTLYISIMASQPLKTSSKEKTGSAAH